MADSLTSGHTACCPLCGAEMLPGQELNQDHVFVRALGGRVTVTTHKQCNSQSGSGSEGSLQGPNTVINFLKAAKGLDVPPVRGTFPSGRRADLNLSDGSVYSPPVMRKAGDGTALSIEGKPAEVEKAYNKWRDRNPHLYAPPFKDLPAGSITPVSYTTVNVDLSYSLEDAEIVAIKSALGACSLAYGPGFAASTFAAALRAVRDDPADPQRQVAAPAYLGRLDASIIPQAAVRAGLSHAEVSALPRLAPAAGETVHDVILVPHNGQQTVLFAHYISELIPPYGIMTSAPLPPLTPGIQPILPVLLRDGGASDRLDVTDFTRILLQPAIDALPGAVNDGTGDRA